MAGQPPRGHGNQQQQSQQQQPQQQGPQYGQRQSQSPTEVLTSESGMRFLKYIVGVFLAIGLGYGIGLILFDAVASDDFGTDLFGLFAFLVPVFGAPIIGMVTGLMTGLRLETDEASAALTSGVGAIAGFIVMLIVLVVFMSIVFSDGGGDGGGGDSSDMIVEMIAFGIGVATTAALTTFVVRRSQI